MQRFLSFLLVFVFCALFVPTSVDAQTYDVSLVSEAPVYSWIDARYPTGFGGYPFTGIQALPSNHFVVGGKCAYNGPFTVSHTGDLYGELSGGSHRSIPHEAGGMYVLDSKGNVTGTRNVCYDTALRRVCSEGGGCSNGTDVIPLGGTQFLRLSHPQGFGIPRSPTVYNAVQGIPQLAQIFFNKFSGGGGQSLLGVTATPLTDADVGKTKTAETGAIANGVLITLEEEHTLPRTITDRYWVSTGGQTSSSKIQNGFYYPQTLSRFAVSVTDGPFDCFDRPAAGEPLPPFCSGTPPYSKAPYGTPIVGIGKYFFAEDNRYAPSLYEMPSVTELVQGQRPTQVEDFDFVGRISAHAIDPTSNNRVATYQYDSRAKESHIVVYEASESGVQEAYRIKDVAPDAQNGLAIMGRYVAYADCTNRRSGRTSCELKVYENGRELSTQSFPVPGIFNGLMSASGVAIAPDGTIAVNVRSRATNSSLIDAGNEELLEYAPDWTVGAVIYFKIGGVTNTSGATVTETSGTGDDPNPADESGFDIRDFIPFKTTAEIFAQYGITLPTNSPNQFTTTQQTTQTSSNESNALERAILMIQIEIIQEKINALIEAQ